jgi:hypothetical protein
MKTAVTAILFLLCCLFSWPASAQSAFPNGVGLKLPVSENFIKAEFSFRYNLHSLQPGTPFERSYYSFSDFPQGYFFEFITLTGEWMPEIQGLQLVHLELIPGRTLQNAQSLMRSTTRNHVAAPPTKPQHFLIGIDAKNKLHYLSGNIFLDPLSECMVNPADLAEVAKIRLYYLLPDELKPIKASEGHMRFETKSNLLNRRIVIDLVDDMHFSIFPKVDPDNRLAVVGGWISGPQQDPLRMLGNLPSD